jgi:2-polyprenyl-3-methyl-5-hydroxy-6-metoxy-1,4-benzoquinol methylase
MIERDPASFRDPQGFVYEDEGSIFRALNGEAAALLASRAEFFGRAIEQGLLLPFGEESGLHAGLPAEIVKAIKPVRIPLITYPYEWCFQQLKDAALNTLDINLLALDHGLTLKDASAFNAQRWKGRQVFIDHTSFEASDGFLPWRPYSQFCRHFLNPLVLAAYRDFHAVGLFRTMLDGIPQVDANSMLPFSARFSANVLTHMILQEKFISRSARYQRDERARDSRSSVKQATLIKQLRDFISGLKPARARSAWADYQNDNAYTAETLRRKEQAVQRFAEDLENATIWDAGANDGQFSRLVARQTNTVLSLDLDHNAVNANYVASKGGAADIHPLVFSISNPTPDLGFSNSERKRLEARSRADAILALALIHHLTVTENLPLHHTSAYFAARCRRLIIEFVDREDEQFKRVVFAKSHKYEAYSLENFIAEYSRHFTIVDKAEISPTRTLFSLERI